MNYSESVKEIKNFKKVFTYKNLYAIMSLLLR